MLSTNHSIDIKSSGSINNHFRLIHFYVAHAHLGVEENSSQAFVSKCLSYGKEKEKEKKPSLPYIVR